MKTHKKVPLSIPFYWSYVGRLIGHSYYYFLDGYSDYNQTIALNYQEKTTFTYPYGTFAYRRMPFGLCNATITFQQCMMSNLMISWRNIYKYLALVLKQCENTKLMFNWEKFYFMVKEGIVLDHWISKNGIEVD